MRSEATTALTQTAGFQRYRYVIATLFGLEELQEVISRFVKPESFSLKSSLRPDNTDAIAVVDSDKLQLVQQRRSGALKVSALNKQVCETLGLEESQQYAVRARFKRLEALADLKMRRAEQLKLARSPCLFPVRHFFRSSRIAERLLQRKAKIESAFLQNASALNYRAVFEAIQAIEHQGAGDACPACSTPLQSVAENPFEKARRELQSLSALDQLQSAERRNQDLIVNLAMGISKRFSGVGLNTQQGIARPLPLSNLESAVINFQSKVDRLEAALVVIQAFEKLLIQNQPELEAYAAACQSKHTEVAQANETVKRLDEQVKDLKQSEEDLRRLFNEKKGAWHACAQANSKIADLSRRRVELIEHGSSNVVFNSFVQELQNEYGNLYEDLISYKLSLERARISGIESKAAEYYKAINNHDDEHERIDSISFDKTSDSYRIKIANTDGTSLDAFSTLSEGHLRALGLSLLLAMAEKNKFPLIVFDDVVNAIDSDHRSNIIDLFFSDPYLRRTQMVVTTHDRLFWERYCIIAERHTQSDQHSSYVLNYTNKGIISVDHAGGFQEKVYRALAVYDVRQALMYCRIWFESMVLEYCLANGLSVTARFEKSQLKKNMYLQISLEKTFSLVEPEIAYDLTHFSLIKNDLVNWSGQNQEHHAFDESSLNLVHSKTSKEVVKIYDAIRLLECQLFPKTKKISGQHLLDTLNQRIDAGTRKIEKLGGAPAEVRAQHAGLLSELQKRAAEVTEELAFIEVCRAAIELGLEPAEPEAELEREPEPGHEHRA